MKWVTAPWDSRQVEALRLWQEKGVFHPYTCSGGGGKCQTILDVTPEGLVCGSCKRVQTEVFPFSVDLEGLKSHLKWWSDWGL